MTLTAAPLRSPLLHTTVRAAAAAVAASMAASSLLKLRLLAGQDAHAYWVAGQGPLTYAATPRQLDAFLYSPLFADAIRPVTVLPWPIFFAVWTVLEVVVLVWLLKPLPLQWAVPVFLACVPELVVGNVNVFLAAAVVAGMRWPVAWLFPILTKVATGVGLLWFAVRGEWRRLLVPAVIGVLLVGVSVWLQPAAWHGWVALLMQGNGSPDGRVWFAVRCLAGVVVVVAAARRGWVWLVPVAVMLVTPVWAVMALAVLTAIPRLAQKNGKNWPGA